MGYKGYGQWGTGVWDLWAIGHRGYGPHRQWVTWPMRHMGNGLWPMGDWDIFAHSIIITGWILTKNLLDIDINVFYLNTGRFFHDELN